MVQNQLNLALRFILEIVILVIAGIWGWNQVEGVSRFFMAIGIPVILAVLWGVFAVKDDPSRSGKTVVPTPGVARLFLEFFFFGFGCWALFDLGHRTFSVILVLIVLFHYVLSIERIRWLLKQK